MRKLLMTTAIIAGSFGAASAQDATNLFRTSPEATELYASNFIGMRVYREEGDIAAEGYAGVQQNWDDIGEINDVILNRDGQVEAVLIDVGGFLGMGESQVAVDMDAIRFVTDDSTDDANDFFLVLNAPRSAFEEAKPYEMSNMRNPNAAAGADATMDQTDVAAGTNVTGTDAAADTTVDAQTEVADGTATTGVNADATATDQTDIAAGATTSVGTDTMMRDGWTPVETAELTSEQLTGANVYGPNDESIGEISDIVLTADGKVEGAVVDVGGFLGLGEKPVQLDLSQVQILRETDGDELRVYVSMTKEQVEALPEFEG